MISSQWKTIFDTHSCKRIFAVHELTEELANGSLHMMMVTATDEQEELLSGQTLRRCSIGQ